MVIVQIIETKSINLFQIILFYLKILVLSKYDDLFRHYNLKIF
jgi:hypothetical protein